MAVGSLCCGLNLGKAANLRQCAPDQLPAPKDGRRYLWKPGSSRETDEIVSAANVEDSVAVVVTTHDDAVYLRDALTSGFAQERHADALSWLTMTRPAARYR
jgi:hypothetical protein